MKVRELMTTSVASVSSNLSLSAAARLKLTDATPNDVAMAKASSTTDLIPSSTLSAPRVQRAQSSPDHVRLAQLELSCQLVDQPCR